MQGMRIILSLVIVWIVLTFVGGPSIVSDAIARIRHFNAEIAPAAARAAQGR